MPSIPGSAAERGQPQPETGGSRSMVSVRRLAAGIALAILVFTALVLLGDARDVASALRHFNWWLAPPIIALTLWNYGWRFVKWEMYLRYLSVPQLRITTSLLVFFSGFSMSLTPGKVGELIKSVYLRRLTNVPINRTSAIVAAERITDAVAMLLLAALGLTSFSYGRPFLAALAISGLIGLVALQRPDALSRALRRAEHWPLVGHAVDHAVAFVSASSILFRPRPLTIAVGLGIVSWLGECLAFYLVLRGLGLPGSWHLVLIATFVLAVSSLAGGASLLPGGLGVADASVAGMLLLLVSDDGMSRTVAAAATLIIRFATLWFAVLLGVVAVFLLERHTIPRGNAVKWRPPEESQRPTERRDSRPRKTSGRTFRM